MFQQILTCRGRCGAARIGGLPLAVAALPLLVLIMITCGACGNTDFIYCDDAGQVHREEEPPRSCILSTNWEALPGSQVSRDISTSNAPSGSTLGYTPPAGSTNFVFSRQPDSYDPATNTYTFLDPNVSFSVTYNLGDNASGVWFDSVRLDWPGGHADDWFTTRDAYPFRLRQAAAPVAAPLPRAASQEDYWYWRTMQGFVSEGITMTQDLAQDILTPWQGEDMFYAMKVPVPPSPPTHSVPLPVVFHSDLTPTLQLIELAPGGGALITAPVEYRLERMTFLEGTRPTGDEEMWVPLGLSADPLIYPTEPFTLTEWEWEIALDLPLDLGGAPEARFKAANLEPVIEIYYCFEDQQGASALLLAGALGGDLPVAFAQEDITCLGPQPLYLTSAPALSLLPAVTMQVTPTLAISLHHYVQANHPMTITLDISSTLNTSWTIYRQPNLTDPIVPGAPIPVTGVLHFWIAGIIPTGTATGGYDLLVTATPLDPPGNARWTRDVLWVGEWQPPAPPGQEHRIYLPLILRGA